MPKCLRAERKAKMPAVQHIWVSGASLCLVSVHCDNLMEVTSCERAGPASRVKTCMDVRVAFFLLSSLPSLMGLPVLMQKYMRSVGGGCVSSNHLSWVEIVCSLARSLSLVPPPFLRPPTFSLLPSSSSLAAPPPPSLNAQKGYDIILEWALRYIALFPPSFLSISPSEARRSSY